MVAALETFLMKCIWHGENIFCSIHQCSCFLCFPQPANWDSWVSKPPFLNTSLNSKSFSIIIIILVILFSAIHSFVPVLMHNSYTSPTLVHPVQCEYTTQDDRTLENPAWHMLDVPGQRFLHWQSLCIIAFGPYIDDSSVICVSQISLCIVFVSAVLDGITPNSEQIHSTSRTWG